MSVIELNYHCYIWASINAGPLKAVIWQGAMAVTQPTDSKQVML
jgi:hypothetical protein